MMYLVRSRGRAFDGTVHVDEFQYNTLDEAMKAAKRMVGPKASRATVKGAIGGFRGRYGTAYVYEATMNTSSRNMAGRATTVDDDAATELDLYAENTGELYPMRQAIEKNLLGKRAKRTYDSAKAIKGFQPLADRAAVMYAREYGGDKSMFNAATRREVARRFRDRFEAEAKIAERNRGLETWVKNDPVVARAERGSRNRSGGSGYVVYWESNGTSNKHSYRTRSAARTAALQQQRTIGGYVTIMRNGIEVDEVGPSGASWLRNRSGGPFSREDRYKIVRMYLNHPSRVIKHGLTMEQVHAHTRSPETSSKTATSARARAHTLKYGPWFDGYDVDTKPRRRRNRSGGCLPCGAN